MAALLQPLVPANALIATFCRSLRIAEVEECFPCNPVVRIYLNLSIISGTGIGAFCCGSKTPEDTETIGRFLVESFGEAIEVDSEAELESVSRITHAMTCGTYLSMQCHMYSAVRAGYPMEQARKIAISAFRGAAETFRQEQDDDLLMRLFTYGDSFKYGVQLLNQYGIVESMKSTFQLTPDMLDDKIKDEFERIKAQAVKA